MSKESTAKPPAPIWAKLGISIGLVAVLACGLVVGASVFISHRYEKRVTRADLLGAERPEAPGGVSGPLNILVIGSDSRSVVEYDPNDPSSSVASVQGERADTIMLVHFPQGFDSAYVISIPRDAYVHIPAKTDLSSDDMTWNGGYWKLNAAYTWGGAPLLVRAVEHLMGLTMNHVAVVDFSSIREVTDAVGGVSVHINQEVFDPRSKRTFQQGSNHLDGRAAEAYVRQRYNLPAGDFDRMKRQQQYLLALSRKVESLDLAKDIGRFDKFLLAVTSSLTVDNSMPVRDLAWTLRGLGSSDIVFLTLPVAGEGILAGPGSVLYVDDYALTQLSSALASGVPESYVVQYAPNDVRSGE